MFLRLRPVLLKLHLYLAFTVGVILVLTGISGGLLVFHDTIDKWLNPALLTVTADNRQPLPYEMILADAGNYIAQHLHDKRYHITSIIAPSHVGSVITVSYTRQPENIEHELSIDPYSGTVQGERISGAYFVSFLFRLHTSLCMGASGKFFMGYVGMSSVLLLVIGFLLWLPRHGQWRYMFLPRPSHAPFIKLQDIHRLTGGYAIVLLLMSCVSGVCMQFWQATHNLTGLAFPVSPQMEQKAVSGGGKTINLDTAINMGKVIFPDSTFSRLYFPDAENGEWFLTFTPPDDPNMHNGYNRILLNPYTGDITGKQSWKDALAGDALLEWVFPLHSGEAFNAGIRILWCVAGCAPLVLLITGILSRNKKMAGRRKQAAHNVNP